MKGTGRGPGTQDHAHNRCESAEFVSVVGSSLMLQLPRLSHRLASGRDQSESLDEMRRNRWTGSIGITGRDVSEYARLDANFNTWASSDYGMYFYTLLEEITISTDTVETTIKGIEVYSAVPGGIAFAHGVGLVGGGFSEGGGTGRRLIFARIDSEEYGVPNPIGNEPEWGTPAAARLGVYPNPVVGHAHFEYELSDSGLGRFLVYDVLGRLVLEKWLGAVREGNGITELEMAGLGSVDN